MKRNGTAEPNLEFMHRSRPFLALLRSCTFILIVLALSTASRADSGSLNVISVAKGVYALIPKSGMPARWGGCNVTVIVNQKDVVVVDTQLGPSWAAEVIGEIRKITDKPVRYVINTHWHRDHVQGNQVFLETFGPGVQLIQQEFTREDQIKNQPTELSVRAPAEVSRTEALLAADKDERGNPLDAAGRSRLRDLLDAQKNYLSEVPDIRVTPSTLTFSDKMVLYDGEREVRLYYFGRAHTRGDTVVYLPADKVVVTGDISQVGVPDMRHSYPVEWLSALESLSSLDWTINIPGHGDVQYGEEGVDSFKSYLSDLVTGVETAVAKSLSEDETVAFVDLKKDAARPDFNERNETVVRRAYEEISGKIDE